MTVYIVAAVLLLEEPALEDAFGDDYVAYKMRVPAFCPLCVPIRGVTADYTGKTGRLGKDD